MPKNKTGRNAVTSPEEYNQENENPQDQENPQVQKDAASFLETIAVNIRTFNSAKGEPGLRKVQESSDEKLIKALHLIMQTNISNLYLKDNKLIENLETPIDYVFIKKLITEAIRVHLENTPKTAPKGNSMFSLNPADILMKKKEDAFKDIMTAYENKDSDVSHLRPSA